MVWTVRYKPKNLKEFVNQNEAVDVFLKWMKHWPRGKALLFAGPAGTGKTSLVEAFAKEKNLDLIQLNASDYRSASAIKEVLGKSVLQQALFKKGKIFFIDEIDGLSGREDRGGVGEIIDMIKESRHPIILTANSPWDSRLRSLREHCQMVEFKKISVWDIEKRLKEICEKEKIEADKEVLRQLARISNGDLRSAINDLETVSQGKTKVTLQDLDLGIRERETSVFDALRMIFKTKTALAAKLSINSVDKDPEEIFWWIENNIANEYEDKEEIAKAYDMLSKADLFRQRIYSRQYWRFKAYMIDLMTGGVATAKKEMYRKFTRYQYPSNLIVLGRSKFQRKDEKERLLALSQQLHCSRRKIKKEFLPFFRIYAKKLI